MYQPEIFDPEVRLKVDYYVPESRKLFLEDRSDVRDPISSLALRVNDIIR